MFQILPMQLHHLDGVQTVQRQAYSPALWETNSAFAQKQRLSANTCFVVKIAGGEVVAYLFSHPWAHLRIPKLNTVLPALPDGSDVLYIHDLAVHPSWHGKGLAQLLMAEVQKTAHQLALHRMALVAVQGAQPFWLKRGFVVDLDAQAVLHDSLRVYGDGAVYMTVCMKE